jgi:RNA-splicing ligase RtcB
MAEFKEDFAFELEGKYTKASMFIKTYEPGVINQVYDIINSPALEGLPVAIMPDAHEGKSGPCGLVYKIGKYVCPDHIGVDIGCSVSMMILNKPVPVEKYVELEHKIRTRIPFGFETHEKTVIDEKEFYKFLTNGFNKYKSMKPEVFSSLPDTVTEDWVLSTLSRVRMDVAKFYKSLGTVGGGNHFIEYDEDKDGNIAAFVLHFGSRMLGLKVCNYWMKMTKSASTYSKKEKEEYEKNLIKEFKKTYSQTHDSMINFKEDFKKYHDSHFMEKKDNYISGYLTGEDMNGYLCDMVFAQLYAKYNHMTVQKLLSDIVKVYGISVDRVITSVHNYIDMEDWTVRKSSIRSYEGEEMVIPFNMRDGVAVCVGKSNSDWLCSAPHGAGRVLGRREAKKKLERGEFTMEEFKSDMEGIVSTSVVPSVIDESPRVYKDTKEIEELIQNTCEIEFRLFPKINCKASDGSEEQ